MSAQDPMASAPQDQDPQETREWLDALDGVIEKEGAERAHFLIEQMIQQAREEGIDLPYSANTEYINTIPVEQQPKYPGNPDLEERIRSYIRWNAMAMVVRANKHTNVGGHIASSASSAVLYDVGFNWFWTNLAQPWPAPVPPWSWRLLRSPSSPPHSCPLSMRARFWWACVSTRPYRDWETHMLS